MGKILNIQVTDKVATYLTRGGDIVCGNADYKVQFSFDTDWAALPKKTARFSWNGRHEDVEIDASNQAAVPFLVRTTGLKVGVYSGDVSTTTAAFIKCRHSARCDETTPTTENDRHYERLAKDHADRSELAADRAETALSGFVTPQMYGAKGDGVTDDTAAIQQAIDENDVIHIPRGIYLISDSLIVEADNRLHGTKGFLGKIIEGDDAKFIITKDVPAIIVRGYSNKLSNLVCCFSLDVERPTSALLELQSLTANAINQCCNNTFENIRCGSLKNVYIDYYDKRNVYGIGIRVVSDGTRATYQNKFIGCNCADLYKGIVIECGSSTGVNSNYFGVDLWNCSYLFDGNGNGNTFEGTHQAPWLRYAEEGEDTAEENVCFRVSGNYNSFHGFTWDCGSWDKGDANANPNTAPYLDVSGYGNVFTASCYARSCRGNLAQNTVTFFPGPSANQISHATNTPLAMLGEGGYPILYAPLTNSLNNSDVKMTLEADGVTMADTPAPTLYSALNDAGIPTNVKALTSSDYRRALVFNCQKGAKITLKIELPTYTDLESLFI